MSARLINKSKHLAVSIFTAGLILLLAAGCTSPAQLGSTGSNTLHPYSAIKDGTDTASVTPISTTDRPDTAADAVEGFVPAYPLPAGLEKDEIPLIFSSDGKSLYIMKRNTSEELQSEKQQGIVIKGDNRIPVDLVRLEVKVMKRQTIARNIPFVSYAKWNGDHTKIAFCGGLRITVYDASSDKLILSDKLPVDSTSYFGWSPDGKAIYTEHPNLLYGSIISLPGQTITHCYETDANLYYKGILDDADYNMDNQDIGRYFATLRLAVDEKAQKENGGRLPEEKTVITDASGKVQAEFPAGRYRGSFAKGFIQIGKDDFGLTFYPDISDPSKGIKMTEQYVYDARYLADGSFLFVTPTGNTERNEFILHFADPKGEEKSSMVIAGAAISISPDCSKGFVGSSIGEAIDLDYAMQKGELRAISAGQKADQAGNESAINEELYAAIRGAMDVYYKNEIIGVYDMNEVGRYFADSKEPEQCALFDMTALLNERKLTHDSDFYNMELRLNKLDVQGEKASALIYGIASNSFGSGMGVGEALELIKKDGRWYVTGLSTFPGSKQYKAVQAKLPGIIEGISGGKLFKGMLKGSSIKAGQIQFWQMSEPHFAEKAEYANFCKVYLKVGEKGSETVYKLVLDKKNYRDWTSVSLTKDRLSGL